MKITNRDVIQNGEQELIDAITSDLDWGVIEQIFEKEHRLKINEDVEYKDGDIIIHNNQIAYRLDFNTTVTLTILVDRNGSFLSLNSSADTTEGTSDDRDDESNIMEKEQEPETNELKKTGELPFQLIDVINNDGEEDEGGSYLLPDEVQEKISRAALHAGDIIKEITNSEASVSTDVS